MSRIQVGVMGSAADLGYSEAVARLAEEVGREVALAGCALVFGAEKDGDSLSTTAARGAKSVGGTTVGITYGKGLDVYDNSVADVVIACGMERGGGREFVVAICSHVMIAISGGSGTLNEMSVAYQSDIPVIGIVGCGGWSQEMSGRAFDTRRLHLAVKPASTAKEAVRLALEAIREGGEH